MAAEPAARALPETPVLEVEDAHVFYGNIHALKGISFAVPDRQIATLIGGNGAGKTTTLKMISGILATRKGEVRHRGEPINEVSPHEIVGRGIVHVPEGRRIFARLSVAENLSLGAFRRKDTAQIKQDEARVLEMFPRLKERYRQVAGTMSGGEQQMLAIGRGLMSKPEVLLLDEPSMGLAPILVDQIFEAIASIREQGVTVLLVEQNALMALKIADIGYVMETGQITLRDSGEALLKNQQVIEAYLG